MKMKLRLAPPCLKQECDLDKGQLYGWSAVHVNLFIFFLNPLCFCVLFRARFAGQNLAGGSAASCAWRYLCDRDCLTFKTLLIVPVQSQLECGMQPELPGSAAALLQHHWWLRAAELSLAIAQFLCSPGRRGLGNGCGDKGKGRWSSSSSRNCRRLCLFLFLVWSWNLLFQWISRRQWHAESHVLARRWPAKIPFIL